MAEKKVTRSYLNERKAHKDTMKLLKDERMEHELTKDQYVAMEIDRNEWRSEFRKREREGGLFYLLNKDGYVTEGVTVPPFAESTYPQEIDIALINKGVYKVINGKMELDNEKLRIVRGGL